MDEYRLHSEKIDIPKGAGPKGFLHTIEQILKLDRVQSIQIDARGNITYTRFVRDAAEDFNIGPKISFESLMPFACARNGVIQEIQVSPHHPTKAISKMFQRVSNERLFPAAFITGASTTLWDWLSTNDGLDVDNRDEFYGLPVLADRHLDDYVLLLAAAYGRGAGITEVQKTFKIIMPQRKEDALDRNSSTQGGNFAGGDPSGISSVGSLSRDANGATSPKAGGGGSGNRGGSSGAGPGSHS